MSPRVHPLMQRPVAERDIKASARERPTDEIVSAGSLKRSRINTERARLLIAPRIDRRDLWMRIRRSRAGENRL